MTCQERRDLLLLYVTGLLEPAEAEALRDHLRTGCPACAGALAEAEATVHQIPLGLPQMAAPASAWEKLEMRVALQEHAEGGAEGPREGMRLSEMSVSPKGASRAFGWTGWAAAAAVAVVMGILLRNANVRMSESMAAAEKSERDVHVLQQALIAAGDESHQLTTRVASLEQKVKSLDEEHGKLLVAMAESKRTLLEELMRSEQFALASGEMAGVTGTLFWNKEAGTWTLMGSHVKPAAAGKTYELWVITAKGEKIAAGTFVPDEAGRVMHETKLRAGMGEIAVAAVTDEPLGGVEVPTGKVQFLTKVGKE